jgi:hypothetical protein
MGFNPLVGITLLGTRGFQLLMGSQQLSVSMSGTPVFIQSARMLGEGPFVSLNRLGMIAHRVTALDESRFQALDFTEGCLMLRLPFTDVPQPQGVFILPMSKVASHICVGDVVHGGPPFVDRLSG